MDSSLLKLPDELIEHLVFYLIDRPCRNDLKDFLSFTSVCRRFRFLIHDERFWRKMALRRDPTLINVENWFEQCRNLCHVRTFLPEQFEQTISRFNENYFCTVEKVQIWPDRVRIYIDEHGDNSLGAIQNPCSSIIRIGVKRERNFYLFRAGISAKHGEFSIANPSSQYRGYLDFPLSIKTDFLNKSLLFEFGSAGYEEIVLLKLNKDFFFF